MAVAGKATHVMAAVAGAGEYVVAEKIVTDEEEVVLMMGPLSSGSLHSMGTHDSSSSLDWALDAAGSKVCCCCSDPCHHKLPH